LRPAPSARALIAVSFSALFLPFFLGAFLRRLLLVLLGVVRFGHVNHLERGTKRTRLGILSAADPVAPIRAAGSAARAPLVASARSGARYRTGREPTGGANAQCLNCKCPLCCLPLALSAASRCPTAWQPPAGLKRLLDASAVGVQIYRCAPPKGAEGKGPAVWNFESPRATFDRPTGTGRVRAATTPARPGKPRMAARSPQSGRARRRDGARGDCLAAAEDRIGGRARPLDQVRAVQRLFTSGGSSAAGHLRAPRRGARGPVPGHVRVLGATRRSPLGEGGRSAATFSGRERPA